LKLNNPDPDPDRCTLVGFEEVANDLKSEISMWAIALFSVPTLEPSSGSSTFFLHFTYSAAVPLKWD